MEKSKPKVLRNDKFSKIYLLSKKLNSSGFLKYQHCDAEIKILRFINQTLVIKIRGFDGVLDGRIKSRIY